MVAQGSPVTIWCQGSLLAEVYRLHKERSSVYWEAKAPQGSRNKAWFHFASSSSSDAGQYWCAYHSRNGWSQRSDTLPLVVTGKRVGQGQVPPTVGASSRAEEQSVGSGGPFPPSPHLGSLGGGPPLTQPLAPRSVQGALSVRPAQPCGGRRRQSVPHMQFTVCSGLSASAEGGRH